MSETIAAAASGFSAGILIVAIFMLGKTGATVGRLERKLDALIKHTGVDVASHTNQEVAELVKAGRKIEAIKLYRELTGAGLAEAKEAVEKM